MNIVDLQIVVISPTGTPIAYLTNQGCLGLSYGLKDMEPGVLTMVLPGDFDQKLLPIDGQIELWQSYGGGPQKLEGDTGWFIRYVSPSTADSGGKIITVMAYSAIELLRRHRVAYYSGASYCEKIGKPWDNLLREVINENYGALATDTNRNLAPWLTVEMDASLGIAADCAMAWDEVLPSLRDVVDDIRSQGYQGSFDVIRTDYGHYEFRVFVGPRGVDHSEGTGVPVIISEERGNLLQPKLEFDWSGEFNFIYGAGQGQGADRIIETAQDDDRIGVSPFNRREGFRMANSASLPATVQAAANAALEEGRPKQIFTGRIAQTESTLYNVDWRWGDIVTAEYAGYKIPCYVSAVVVTIQRDGSIAAEGQLRSVTNV